MNENHQRRMKRGDRPSADDLDWTDATDRAAEAAQPASTDLQQLKALALAADQGEGQHIYTHWRDSNNHKANEAWHLAASPAVVLDLIARIQFNEREFKNFHRSLCARFGYTHDDRHWKRDQVSLEEHIAARIESAAAPVPKFPEPGYSDSLANRVFHLPCNWKGDPALHGAVLLGHTMACEQAYNLIMADENARAAVSAATKPAPLADINAKQLVNDLCNIAITFHGKSALHERMTAAIGQYLATKPAAAPAPQALLDHAHAEPTYTGEQMYAAGRKAALDEAIAVCIADRAWRLVDGIRAIQRAGEVSQGAAPTAADVRDAAPEECWSRDEEDFNHTSLGDLLCTHDDLKPGDTVWVGEAVHPDAAQMVNVDSIIENIGEAAYDIGGEHAEDYPDVTDEQSKELERLVADWLNRSCKTSFWTVKNIKPYVLSGDDFPHDKTPLHAEFAAQPNIQEAGK